MNNLPLYGQIDLPQNLSRRVRERLASYVKVCYYENRSEQMPSFNDSNCVHYPLVE